LDCLPAIWGLAQIRHSLFGKLVYGLIPKLALLVAMIGRINQMIDAMAIRTQLDRHSFSPYFATPNRWCR
jgi:hypothetical protein